MKTLTKLFLGTASLAGTLLPAAARADISASVALTTDYRFRGISQNSRDIAEQGSLTWSDDGFYIGTWASKVNWGIPDGNPSVEVDLFGGKHFDLDGTDLNIEAYYYSYPDFNTFGGTFKNASFFEGIAQLSHSFDKLTVTGTFAYSPEFTLGAGDGEYLQGTVSYAATDWLSISGNVGHQWVDALVDYTHWDIGATASWHNFALDARYVDTDLSTFNCAVYYMPTRHACSGGFVASLTYNVQNFP